MTYSATIKTALRRGALVTAANWPVVLIQFIAESTFKLLLLVPILGGAFLVTLALGRDLVELLQGDLKDIVTTIADGLLGEPIALISFLFAFLLVLLGGSAFTFLVKGGTVRVLADTDATVGPIEEQRLHWTIVHEGRFSIERFTGGCADLFRRYLRLGFTLIAIYLVSGGLYLLALVGAGRTGSNFPLLAAGASILLVVWITLINLLYLLVQIAAAVSGRGVLWSFGDVLRFLRGDFAVVVGLFGAVLLLVILATATSIGATAGLGLIAFVPLAGLAVLPLQLGAWLLRSLVFEYLGLTALSAYLHRYGVYRRRTGVAGVADVGRAAHSQ